MPKDKYTSVCILICSEDCRDWKIRENTIKIKWSRQGQFKHKLRERIRIKLLSIMKHKIRYILNCIKFPMFLVSQIQMNKIQFELFLKFQKSIWILWKTNSIKNIFQGFTGNICREYERKEHCRCLCHQSINFTVYRCFRWSLYTQVKTFF